MFLREMNITDFTAADPGFTDMKPGDYGYDVVAKAVELGFIDGKTAENGTKYFDAWSSLTRSQMAKMMAEAYDLIDNQRISFIDVYMIQWANNYVNKLASNNITTGYQDSTFRPQEMVSRQHFAVFMARLLNDDYKINTQQTSFMPDRTNTYVYQMGRYITTFSHFEDNLWLDEDLIRTREFNESENGIVFGAPQMSFSFTLGYPVKLGHSWMDQNGVILTITSTDATVTTSAGTFTNAVIASNDSYTDYYVPNIGLVKSTFLSMYGEERTIAELIEIR